MAHAPSNTTRILKAEGDGRTSTSISVSRALPRHVVTRAGFRVGNAALMWAFAYATAITLNEYAAHRIGTVPPHGWNLGHTVATVFVAISVGLWGISRLGILSPERLLDLGLVYEVVGGFSVVLGTSAGMVWDPQAHILGLSWISVWIVGFPFVIPATPRRAALAAFTTALMAPAGLAAYHILSGTPMSPPRVWSGLTMPTLICAGIATAGSRIVYGLSRDVERARALGAYRLEERLSQGGMGEIWRARHHMLARPAAVKLVRLDTLRGTQARQAAVSRFEREAQMTARLTSLHTVRLYDFGVTEDGTFYYAMELLEGLDLESLVNRDGPMPPERAVHMLVQACRSLAEAHGLGLVHRDIKPANLFVCRQGQDYDVLKVLDFGLVRPENSPGQTLLTGDATVVGTPAYMAPEYVTGAPIGPPVDVYALGCVGYWLLTGQRVFDSKSPIEQVMRHLNEKPVSIRARSPFPVPEALEAALMQCLAKDPDDRPESSARLEAMLLEVPLERTWTPARARDAWREATVQGAEAGME
jgi:serine/threonine-protein kinase